MVLALCYHAQAQNYTKSVSYKFDDAGRLTEAIYANGTIIKYTYDALGNRLQQVITVSNTLQPDLQITATTASSTSFLPGTSVTIGGTFANNGTALAVGNHIKVYLSDNTTLETATDLYIGQITISSLGVGITGTSTVSMVIPTTATAGSKQLIFKIDANNVVTESNENNNIALKPVTVATATTADLVIQNPSLSASSVVAGSSLTTSFSIKNIGALSTGATSSLIAYLSSNNSCCTGDVNIGTYNTPILASGAISNGALTLTIPNTTVAGNYYVLLFADANNVINEGTAGNNNNLVQTLMLTVTAATTTCAVPTGFGANNATSNSANIFFSLPAGATGVLEHKPSTSSTWSSANIAAGAISYTLSSLSANTTYNIRIKSVCTGGVSSGYATSSFTTTNDCAIPAASQLWVTNLTNNSATLNTPTSAATQYSWQYRAQGSSTWTTVTSVLNLRSISGLLANTTYAFKVSLYCSGVWTLYSAAQTFTTAANIANFTLSSPQSSPATFTTGATVGLGCTVNNIGTANVSTTTQVGVYLSANNTYEATDQLLTTIAVSAVNAGSALAVNKNFAISAAAGNYYLIYRADNSNQITESNETDNTTYVAITINAAALPNYVIQNEAISNANIVAGSPITASCNVRNIAVGNATTTSDLKIFLSSDQYYSANDLQLGNAVNIPALPSSAIQAVSQSVTIPNTTAPGLWYILFVADINNVLAETLETDNTAYKSISVNNVNGLSATPSVINATSNYTTTTITVTSNQMYTITSSASWISTNTTSGAGNGSFVISVFGNSTSTPRSGTVTLYASGSGQSFVINITQQGISQGSLNCSNATMLTPGLPYYDNNFTGGDNVMLYSCLPSSPYYTGNEKIYSYQHNGGTFSAELLGASSSHKIFVLSSCDPNSCIQGGWEFIEIQNLAAGTYYIVVEGYENASGTYSIVATSGYHYYNCMTPSFKNVPAAGATFNVSLQVNTSWTLNNTAAWVSPNVTSGTGAQNIVLTISANTLTTVRQTTFSVTSGGATSYFTITQDGTSPTILCTPTLNPSYTHIQSAQLGSIFTNNSGSNNGYGNFTATNYNVQANSQHTITLTPGNLTIPLYWLVWIDLNKDGNYWDTYGPGGKDFGEILFSNAYNSPSQPATYGVFSGLSRKFPNVNGTYNLRIMEVLNIGDLYSCNGYGEAEDYTITIYGGTGKTDETTNTFFHLSPNPATNEVSVSFDNSDIGDNATIAIYNIAGQQVIQKSIEENRGTFMLDVSALASGIYLVQLRTQQGTQTAKLVIENN